MSDKNGKQLSISFRVDEGVVEHNNRDFLAKNVDKERIRDNITYQREDLREFYQKLFGQALADYNAGKKRPYQRIPDYYDHIKNGKQEKLFEEIVVQFGDMETCGLKSGKWEEAKLMLDDYMKSFERRNPNLKVFNAVLCGKRRYCRGKRRNIAVGRRNAYAYAPAADGVSAVFRAALLYFGGRDIRDRRRLLRGSA